MATCARRRRYRLDLTPPLFLFLPQFLVYFIYFTLLTVVYFASAAVVIFRHYRNRPAEGGGRGEEAEPRPAAGSEADALSNGKSARA